MINILLGQISDAEKNIKIMEQMFDKNMVEKTLRKRLLRNLMMKFILENTKKY